MAEIAFPPAMIARFRGLSLERIERIEASWAALTQGKARPDAGPAMARELHTLKGDAHMVGFQGVSELCHKLEEIFTTAERRRYIVPEELDLVVTMAIRFLAALVRKHAGASVGGLDVVGFLRQVDAVLSDTRFGEGEAPEDEHLDLVDEVPALSIRMPERLTEKTRLRLAATATRIFLEAHIARGASHDRLWASWLELAAVIETCSTQRLSSIFARHDAATRQLARSQGKQIEISIEVADDPIPIEASEALDVAALHALRNAVDHGIELPDERRAAGKPRAGLIRIRGHRIEDGVEVTIEDDGRGIDWASVRQRGVERGLLTEATARDASELELLELLFLPAFSTRDEATEISGRGVGLDAVRAAVRRAGGADEKVTLTPRASGGTVLSVEIPTLRYALDVNCFKAPSSDLLIAIPVNIELSAAPISDAGSPPHPSPIDPLTALGFSTTDAPTSAAQCDAAQIVSIGGAATLSLLAGDAPRRATALRTCPTSDDQPAEVVLIDGHDAVLLRPTRLPRT